MSKKANRAVPQFLLHLAYHYGVKANRVRSVKGPEHLHTRRLERIAKHLRAAYDGIVGEGEQVTDIELSADQATTALQKVFTDKLSTAGGAK